jgi:hypothetical protein
MSADDWRSRSSLPTISGSQSARTTAHFAPAGPTKSGNVRSVYFSYPRWEQDAYELKELRASQYRKAQADKIISGTFYPPDGERLVTSAADAVLPAACLRVLLRPEPDDCPMVCVCVSVPRVKVMGGQEDRYIPTAKISAYI